MFPSSSRAYGTKGLRILLCLVVAGILASPSGQSQASPVILPPSIWVMDTHGGQPTRLLKHARSHAPDLEWSPDGRSLLMEEDVLVAVPVDGSKKQRLHESLGDFPFGATWSPDGSTIAFDLATGGARDSNIDIYTLDVDSGDVTRLTRHPKRQMYAAWSPDSSRLAFARLGTRGGVYVMNADGTERQRVLGGVHGELSWSPDGEWLAVNGSDEDIWILHPDGTEIANITNDDVSETDVGWSPDSQRLVFSNHFRGSLVVIDRDGTNRKTIFRKKHQWASSPMWSPDGARIVFEASNLFTIKPDGTGLKNLRPGGIYGRQPVFSPDGSMIAFERN
jgi:Tol biopolymer transport system component